MYHIIDILQVLGKSGRGCYDLPYLFRMLHKISQPILIHQANTLSTPIFSNKMYFFISYHRKYSQSEFRNSIVYMVVLCPLLVLCALILFLSKSSMWYHFYCISSAVWVMSEPNSSLNINVQVMTKNKWLVGYSMVYHSALHCIRKSD